MNRNGFTLVEMLVAIAVFAVVVTIAVGGFAQALRTQRQVTALLLANSNAGFILEQMAREMRTSGSFSCSGSCDNINFINADGVAVSYSYDATEKRILRDGNPITSQSVAVEYVQFVIQDADPYPADPYPTRITVLLGIAPQNAVVVEQNVLNFQTSVSARFDE